MLYTCSYQAAINVLICGNANVAKNCNTFFYYLWFALFLVLLSTSEMSKDPPLCFVPGEDIHTSLYGAAIDVNIRLDRNSLTVEKTYLTLSNHRSVVIHNRSEIIAHFQWKAFVTQEEEDQQKLRFVWKIHFSKIHCPRVKLSYGLKGYWFFWMV